MARNGSGVFDFANALPSDGNPGQASDVTLPFNELKDDANAVRPIGAGGTGGGTAAAARTALGIPAYVDGLVNNSVAKYAEGSYTLKLEDQTGNQTAADYTANFVLTGSIVHVFLSGVTNISSAGMVGTEQVRIPLPSAYDQVSGLIGLGPCMIQRLAAVPGNASSQFLAQAIPGGAFAKIVNVGGTQDSADLRWDHILTGVTDIVALSFSYKADLS